MGDRKLKLCPEVMHRRHFGRSGIVGWSCVGMWYTSDSLFPGIHGEEKYFIERSFGDFNHAGTLLRTERLDRDSLEIGNGKSFVALFELLLLVEEKPTGSIRKEIFVGNTAS